MLTVKGAEEPEEAWNYLLFLTMEIIRTKGLEPDRAGPFTYLLLEA